MKNRLAAFAPNYDDFPETLAPLLAQFGAVRHDTERLCAPLALEDFGLQPMPECSPPKWHLAHTSWFFETFLLKPYCAAYREYHPQFGYLFNSYYTRVGDFFPRAQRGQLSRPTVDAVYGYRKHVDAHMAQAQDWLKDGDYAEFCERLMLGIQHEQQHQELLLTDIKYSFAQNPLRPAYLPQPPGVRMHEAAGTPGWRDFDGGLIDIGHVEPGFAFDNEGPRHKVFLSPYRLAERPCSNAEYLEFMEAGAYSDATWWLSEGWRSVCEAGWNRPLYWEKIGADWWHYTLHGMRPLDLDAPVCHLSFYEADAYARWAGARLPREAEWEHAAATASRAGNLRDSALLQPVACGGEGLRQLFGDVWEWTQSAYAPYPGYRADDDALGEYNGKFMSGQMVLRGGSCLTPADHIRASYRNFFAPADRWQCMGLRLARDLS